MSRSRRKNPAITLTMKSNKHDKRKYNSMFRRISRKAIKLGIELPNNIREISDVWNFATDGLAIYNNKLNKKYLRK